ncbi:phage head morphogenesis protein [Arthrobacter sp. VKM Ac-2550]|uniref:phage head morphogenesis protein n=1 Tax=Crystallibacter permensis TaxID=1938888 RepID=UPI002227C752|nr:phage head morphogenesis protein [Arthrobacter sp. VKM Ac-2550]MCW2132894.1 phage putative head morphogenesis protein, SPP1 gp7 family [Arthrobacter sp. VKM Ac-2550]
MAVTEKTLALIDARRIELGRVIDGQTLALITAWIDAWDTLAPEFSDALTDLLADAKDGTVTGHQVSRNQRLRAALALAVDRLDELADMTSVTVQADVQRTMLDAAASQIQVIQSQLPAAHQVATLPTFSRVSDATMDAMVLRTTERIHSLTRPLSDDSIMVMRRNLVRGIAVGDNPRTTARRIMRQTENDFNGGLQRAMTIARTETLDAHRAATKAADEANKDVTAGWLWGATLSARTCPACLAMHGQEFPVEQAGPEGHQNCRCDRIPKTKTWRELGFDIDEPEPIIRDSREWFDGLTPDSQLTIMGPERLRMLNDGSITWDDLAKTRHTEGWRDSIVPVSVQDLHRLAA